MSSASYSFLFFFLMFKMPTDAQQSVPSRVSRHFKWMERSQYGGSERRAINASRIPVKPFHLFTSIDWAKEGRDGGKKKKEVSGFYTSGFMLTRMPSEIVSGANLGLDGGSNSRIRYSRIWTARTTGNAKSGSRITIGTA